MDFEQVNVSCEMCQFNKTLIRHQFNLLQNILQQVTIHTTLMGQKYILHLFLICDVIQVSLLWTLNRSRATFTVFLFWVDTNNRNTKQRCEICSKVTKTPQRLYRFRSVVFIVSFEQILHLLLFFLLLT